MNTNTMHPGMKNTCLRPVRIVTIACLVASLLTGRGAMVEPGRTPSEQEQVAGYIGPVMGDHDWGCIFASVPIIRKDGILLYYGANDGRFMAWRNGFFCLARLRPDGFAGYEQIAGGSNKTGSVTTKPVTVLGSPLRVSADVAPSGFVKIIALDKENNKLAESELIAKTVTDAEVKWNGDFSLGKLAGEPIRLRFELRGSKLFSFSFE